MPIKAQGPTGIELLRIVKDALERGQTLGEIARAYGLTYVVLKSRLQRAREKSHDQAAEPAPDLPVPAHQPGVSAQVEGNTMALDSGFGRRIVSLADLLEACQVDQSEWVVERYVINKWEVGAKTSQKDLTWADGLIVEGRLKDEGKLTIEPLIQVKAWLIKRKPEPIEPVIRPIALSLVIKTGSGRSRPVAAQSHGDRRSGLVLPDIQFGFRKDPKTGALEPFHDRRALGVALALARSYAFDDLLFLGDVLDLAEWSDKYIRSPDFALTTQAAIVEAAWWLAEFRAALPAARLVVIEGNHERRMRDAIAIHLPAAFHLKPAHEIALPAALTIPRLLGFEALGAEWVGDYPNGTLWLNDHLALVHGDKARSGPGDTAKAMVTDSVRSVIFGHIHRLERATRTLPTRNGPRVILALSPGCLCRVDGVVPGHTLGQNWQQGLGIVHYRPDGWHAAEAIAIDEGQAVWAGQVYQSPDMLPALRADTGWQF